MTFPDPSKLFSRFTDDAGTDAAARANFELLVTDLVIVRHPDATTVEGAGGRDWGIDTVVGELAGGQVRLWQSKFIKEWKDDTPRSQVYSSYNSAKKQAGKNGYTLKTWTLVVPCVLSPSELQWFGEWNKKRLTADGIAIDIWDGTKLRHLLQQTEAEGIARRNFSHLFPQPPEPPKPKKAVLKALGDPASYNGALFVRQLREAGRIETDTASAQFFATDALLRDYANKGEADALNAMHELELDVRDTWEARFNNQLPLADETGKIPDLIDHVLNCAGTSPDPDGITLTTAHKKGAAHRIVETKHAGWVAHWRDIAEAHAEPTAAYSTAIAPAPTSTSTPVTPEPLAAVDSGAEAASTDSPETS